MTDLATSTTPNATRPRGVVVLVAAITAVAINLLIYAGGRVAGGNFTFTQDGSVAHIDAVTVAAFSALPLGLGLTVVALLARRIPWTTTAAIIVAPALAIATIAIMTIPVDLDTISTVALATCHLTLVPISIVAIRRLHPRQTGS